MIVYGERDEKVLATSYLQEILRTSDEVEAEIRFGQFEAAVVDALCPDVDDWTPVTELLREAALTRNYARVLGWDLPVEISIRPAEGFAWYSLYPSQYADAARRFVNEMEPDSCVTVGIRSIGTTLSTAVRRVVGGPSFTVRPRGHPFDRRVRITPSLSQIARQGRWALVVDEGPGLSGSSFVAVCEMLLKVGFPENRIVLFPAHDPDPSRFVSEKARAMWTRFPRYVEPFRADAHVPARALDLSGGAWREYVGIDVPVVPHLERRKYLDEDARVLWKWAGLGHHGRMKLERARRVAAMVPRALSVQDGFVLMDWVDARRPTKASEDLLGAMTKYLVCLNTEFRSKQPVDYASLANMVQVNTGIEVEPPDADTTRVAVDGRMLPHEWLQTSRGWLKADALDHHDDHLFPGCQDIAWDIAGAAVEFGFDPEVLAERYLRQVTDAGLRRRLPFHVLAYAAFRAGYCSMFGLEELAARYLEIARRTSSNRRS